MTCRRSSSAAAAPASPSTPARRPRCATRMERMAEAHRRTLDQLSSGVAVFDGQRRLAFYNESYRRLWGLDQAFLDCQSRRFQRARPAARGAQTARAAGLPGLEGQAARSLSRRRARELHLVPARRPRRQRRHHAEPRRRRHLSVRQRHREPRSRAPLRPADPGPARDARQSRRSGRGVRQQWPRRTVQSGLREDVEAVGGSAEGAAAHRDRGSLVQAAVRRRADLAGAARGDHRDREPGAGAR